MISQSHPAAIGHQKRRGRSSTGEAAAPAARDPVGGMISCDGCVRQGSEACDDCPLGNLVELGRDGSLTREDIDALNRLAAAGLIPHLKYLAAA